MDKNILIVGLRRSGTTVFWETFRKDDHSLCFDEPFHPALWQGAVTNSKGTWPELAEIWNRTGSSPIKGALPIYPADELVQGASVEQKKYLGFLFDQSERVVVDSVRIWNKLPDLLQIKTPLLVIHLVRSPVSWVTAQMVPPYGLSWRRDVMNIYRRTAFFKRKRGYNNWHFEEIIEEALRQEHTLWKYCKADLARIKMQRAYVKLLAFWWSVTKHTHLSLQKLDYIQHVTVSLEEFSGCPEKVIDDIYSQAGWLQPRPTISHVKGVREGWKASDQAWVDAFSLLGVPHELLVSKNVKGKNLHEMLS